MLESLPLTIRTELELIRRQNSDRGALKFLPSLFDLILNDKKLKMLICDFEEKNLEKQKAEENEKQKAIEWITEKAKKLNTHPLADHFFIKPVIQQLDRTLNLEDIRCGQSYISSLMKDLKEVACLLANFGTHEIFEGWAPIEIKTDQIVLYDLSLPVTKKITKISPQSKLGE